VFDAVLFDLDGVIVDSRTAVTRSINHALTSHGFPEQDPETLYRFIGPPLEAAFETLLGELDGDSGRAPALVKAYRERYRDAAATETRVYPGMAELLQQLAPLPLAVATLKPRQFAGPLLAELGLTHHFVAIEGPALHDSDEAKQVTAARALARLGNPAPATTPLVGDRASDIAAARALGLPAIAVGWGMGDAAELAAADMHADTPADLLPLLRAAA
jgi:phosphoglycolate phosphatase